jgi:hypothetical protein
MVLGAIVCPLKHCQEVANRLRTLKSDHGLSRDLELKWVKVSPAKLSFYEAAIDDFFMTEYLQFRAVVIPDKSKLNHAAFNQSHDEFYYKMWFVLLKQLLVPGFSYRIYIDIKDTRGVAKVRKLEEILRTANYDFDKEMIERIQQVRSHEVEILQLTDLFIGALSYVHRGLASSAAKLALIERIRFRSGLSLKKTTLPRAKKVNLLIWNPQEW